MTFLGCDQRRRGCRHDIVFGAAFAAESEHVGEHVATPPVPVLLQSRNSRTRFSQRGKDKTIRYTYVMALPVSMTAGGSEGVRRHWGSRQDTLLRKRIGRKRACGPATAIGLGVCEQVSHAFPLARSLRNLRDMGPEVFFDHLTRQQIGRLVLHADCCPMVCRPCDSHSTAGCCRRC